jgi:signal transduction histidine kinase
VILDHREQVLYAVDPSRQGQLFADAFRPFGMHLTAILGGMPDDQDIYSIKDLNEEWMIRVQHYPGSPRLLIVMLGKYGGTINSIEGTAVTMVVLTFVLAIVATLLLYYFISSTTTSIQRVTRGAKAIAAGNLDYQIQVKSNDETRVLADAFNRMAARLKEMIARESEQKQFESFARLSAVLTHDLKNAILSLSLLVSNMERKFDREGFREDAMLTLSESVAHLQGLVTKLSDPLAQTRSERQMEDLSAIVERVLQRTAEQASERYQITTDLLPQTNAAVDAKAIERVVENLVINAIQAMPGGGQLRLSTRRENGQAMIVVADTGKGMSEEFMRDRLFRPFATTKKKGIGLGLYSCREIVEQHGGRIEVTSKIDEGTEFRVALPLAAGEAKEREEQEMQVGS